MKILRTLHTISSDTNLSFEDKLKRLLDLGCNLLNMPVGVVSKIENNQYTVIAASAQHDSLKVGAEFVLNSTFCADTIHAKTVVSYYDINQIRSNHPVAEFFQLYSYIGIPLTVNGKLFGTVSFLSPTARAHPFIEAEQDYVILLSEWISTELSRKFAFDSVSEQNETLSRQNKMLNQMSELAGVGTWEIDVRTNKVHWSKALKKLYELPPDFDVSLEAAINIIKYEKERDRVANLITHCIQTGTPISTEIEAVTTTGKSLWVAIRAQAEFENGVCTRVLGASQDITKQVHISMDLEHKRQIAEQALQARSQFLANMSHEIRTPINGVLGMLASLSKTNLSDKQQELCCIAHESAATLLGLINDILDFSKIDAGEMTLENVPINLGALIEKQVKVFEHTAKKKGIQLLTDVEAVKPLRVQGDPVRIQQILTNLINNAVKFTHQGVVKVKARALTQPHNRYLIHLNVEDTGIGIEEERLQGIFSPFQQGDSATTREFGGTGLGLSIISQIAEMMGGGIRVKSRPGEGSTFTVTLQLSQADDAAMLPPAETVSEMKSLAGYRILVVEDNTINQIVITEQLNELEVSIDLADNGQVAVDKVAQSLATNQLYDLILMDCQMPIMDGYTAAAKIRALGNAASSIPIIALTANVLAGEREKCAAAGMDDYLSKPINVSRLSACLQRFLQCGASVEK
ncbi:ATP-binding protein [Alteromonas ponticola]|uniref:histidine kinase n=1 Tax=Alteromonas aquimaris TaxID=2998417 RepID=A0ABT3P659_9ALTE|nr:ATP-binding protein [Alteromonas aquimaris]MCW8108030.1 ATP-binding protein [Alteromonas aquimaris]